MILVIVLIALNNIYFLHSLFVRHLSRRTSAWQTDAVGGISVYVFKSRVVLCVVLMWIFSVRDHKQYFTGISLFRHISEPIDRAVSISGLRWDLKSLSKRICHSWSANV